MTDPDDRASVFPGTTVPPAGRRIFANRTLNLKSVAVVGFDMDYTLIHYRTEEWERCAYGYALARLKKLGWPVEGLAFEPDAFTLGLVVDQELGNVVKANRFGFVKRASHGTRMLGFEEQRTAYSRVQIDLAEPRWRFMNTLFSLSETCLFAQLVDALDAGKLPKGTRYGELLGVVQKALDAAHAEGELKADIVKDPARFVEPDEELPLALFDMKQAGKKLLLITNSEWAYADAMMHYAFDRHLKSGSWRSLFDLVIVQARKPDFFTGNAPAFEIVEETALLKPTLGRLRQGAAYVGGNAQLVEDFTDTPGEEILYVGDHVYADVHVTKRLLRWRTALVIRELEAEIAAIEAFRDEQAELDQKMAHKEQLESLHDRLRLLLERHDASYGATSDLTPAAMKRRLSELRRESGSLDERVSTLSRRASELVNARWGPPMRAGNDKSHLARQVERHADVYTSRVANFLYATPFAYLRSLRGSLPHDPC
jgi:HAD superfamily 5'-nucleotidase-like hydrolase